jgi:hypothetical protein
MPNECINLRFIEFEPLKAECMLGCAREFGSARIDGTPGIRHGTVFSFHGWACVAYWTPTRTVVVREVSPTLPTPKASDV